MVNTLDTEKLAQTLKDLKEAVQSTILAFERVQNYIITTLEIIESSAQHPSSEAITPEPSPVEIEPPVVVETTIPPAPEPVEVAPAPEPVQPSIPTPPPPPPPPAVSTLQTGEVGHPTPQPSGASPSKPPVSTFGPGPTASAPSGANFEVSDSLDKVFQLAQRGGTGLQLHQALLDARDVVQQIVSVHPAFHEIASYSRELKMVGSNPLTDNQQIELKDHLDDWKRRLVK